MAFTLSHYIYPLQEKIVLSNILGYSLDNPRTPDEIDFVLSYIQPAIIWSAGDGSNAGLRRHAWELTLARIERENRGQDKHLFEALKGKPEEVLAKNWIILRYEDKGEFEGIRKDLNRLIELGWSDNAQEFLNNYYQLESYCHLLQLFVIENKEYYGQTLGLLASPFALFEPRDTEHMRHVVSAISQFERNIVDDPQNFGYGWSYFPVVKEKLQLACQVLEKMLLMTGQKEKKTKGKDAPGDKILYVGDLLRIIYSQSHDLKVKFILLVSILELLITHAPDISKNVEDSIRKQFILKLTILLYYSDPGMDLTGQKKKLSDIYDIRSSIAHGGEMKVNNQELRQLLKDLYTYVKVVFTTYVNGSQFVDFLKAN